MDHLVFVAFHISFSVVSAVNESFETFQKLCTPKWGPAHTAFFDEKTLDSDADGPEMLRWFGSEL